MTADKSELNINPNGGIEIPHVCTEHGRLMEHIIDIKDTLTRVCEGQTALAGKQVALELTVKKATEITLINGKERTISISEAVKEIHEATQWQRDKMKIKKILSRYPKIFTYGLAFLKYAVIVIILLHFFKWQVIPVITSLLKLQ